MALVGIPMVLTTLSTQPWTVRASSFQPLHRTTLPLRTPVLLPPNPVPPHGFDPLTAPAQTLKKYGFPPKPKNVQALKQWVYAMKHARFYQTMPPVIGKTPYTSTTYNSHWAGYSENTSGAYNVSSDWIQPSVSSTFYIFHPPGVAFWAGMGGVTNSSLIQAGATSSQTSPPSYRFWFEDYPNAPIYMGPYVTGGDQVYVSVYDVNNGTAQVYWENITTGGYYSHAFSAPYYNGSTADFIAEDVNGYPTFGHDPFLGAQYSTNLGGGLLPTSPTAKYIMTNGSTNTAWPGSVNGSGNFTIYSY